MKTFHSIISLTAALSLALVGCGSSTTAVSISSTNNTSSVAGSSSVLASSGATSSTTRSSGASSTTQTVSSSSVAVVPFTLSPVGNYLGYRYPKATGANPAFALKILSNDTAISCDTDLKNSDSTLRVANCINNTATGSWMDTSAYTLNKHQIRFTSMLYLTYSWNNFIYFKDNGVLHIATSAGIYSGTSSTIVGTWSSPFTTAVSSTTIFNADKTFSFSLGSLNNDGTYVVKGDTLLTTYTGSTSADTVRFRIEDGQLMTWSIGDDYVLEPR